ncbi:hypothetical protein EVAR_94838_1 [Eumeta japonica]|uniref:Uncharacterized protein n=1 Tax=Eumeta variegata TaxID=151549 RepID=A0A4C1UHC9_EUMVA|nr:hypothetical protein EVAR_94838_1 [Eumeta japonica]
MRRRGGLVHRIPAARGVRWPSPLRRRGLTTQHERPPRKLAHDWAPPPSVQRPAPGVAMHNELRQRNAAEMKKIISQDDGRRLPAASATGRRPRRLQLATSALWPLRAVFIFFPDF